ncbi:hypothetical protein BS78_01G038400 [Paspalum vaginatum]|nr:hypothetical protein BS78_01G038400 [Paspalum vaginatum]
MYHRRSLLELEDSLRALTIFKQEKQSRRSLLEGTYLKCIWLLPRLVHE